MVRKRRRVSRRRITRRKTRRRTGSKTMTVRIRGRGGYWTDKLRAGASAVYKGLQQHVPAGTWERLGTAGGGAMGGSTGAALGGLLGKGISSITGFGDYSVKGNSLTVPEGVMVPTFGDMARATRIRHREYITDVSNVAEENFPYAAAIGSLMYLALGTRPEIAQAVAKMAKFTSKFGTDHIKGVKRILR